MRRGRASRVAGNRDRHRASRASRNSVKEMGFGPCRGTRAVRLIPFRVGSVSLLWEPGLQVFNACAQLFSRAGNNIRNKKRPLTTKYFVPRY